MRAALLLAALALCSCTAVVRGSPLSDRLDVAHDVYLSSGSSPRPYRTLAFAQIRGYGVAIAGAVDIGEAGLDSAIRGVLAQEARKLGGNGVLNIEFLDENPPTPIEKAQSAINSISSISSGKGGPETKDRWVVVTGEIVQFTDGAR
jgi:hypothetical protein